MSGLLYITGTVRDKKWWIPGRRFGRIF